MRYSDLYEAKAASFRLHPSLDPEKYRITDSLRDVRNWRAFTYMANSGGEPGAMGNVGYVMISLTDNTIIPIARGDEHNTGRDLVHKLGISGRFLPIYALGPNYIYYRDEIKKYLIALNKYLSYGGPDGVLNGSNDLRNKAVTYSQFVERNGEIDLRPGELAPVGAAVVAAFEALAAALTTARQNSLRSAAGSVFQAAKGVHKVLSQFSMSLIGSIEIEDVKALPALIKQAQAEGDIQAIETLFFGFEGVKNKIHNALRAAQRKNVPPGTFDFDLYYMLPTWGDLDLAVDRLGRF